MTPLPLLHYLLRRLHHRYRRWGCEDHYLVWVNRDGRRYGCCMNCLAETEGWR